MIEAYMHSTQGTQYIVYLQVYLLPSIEFELKLSHQWCCLDP